MSNGGQLLKRWIKIILGRDLHCSLDVDVPKVRVGSRYGGYYICSSVLSEAPVVYSFGVGKDISFDLEMIQRFRAKVFAFDPTPQVREWIRTQSLPKNFRFYPYGIAHFDGKVRLYAPEHSEHISHSFVVQRSDHFVEVPVRRLKGIMEELGHARIDLVKMDVEGAEYEVIQDWLESRIYPEQILVEFHHWFPEIKVERTRKILEKLRTVGYRLFAIDDYNYSLVLNSALKARSI